MDLEIIEKNLEILDPTIKCKHCSKKIGKFDFCYYLYMRDTYYCLECQRKFPNIDTAFDIKFNEIDKKMDEYHKSLHEKNKRILFLESQMSKVEDISFFLEEIVKQENNNKNQ